MRSGARVTILRRLCAVGLTAALLGACGYGEQDYPDDPLGKGQKGGHAGGYQEQGSVFGSGGLNVFGGGEEQAPPGQGVGVAVNSYLWRASLDTISFMPLASADPFGGVIITDWYTPPETQSERFKVTVYILGRDLRADGVRAAVFRQVLNGDGTWIDAQVEQATALDLENAILTRARQLRVAGLE